MRTICALLLALLLGRSVSATTINVPADQPTIQAGIDAAVNGDTVLVADGTYTGTGNRDISLDGKAILLQGIGGPLVTIIDCQGTLVDPGRGFLCVNQESQTTVIEGFQILDAHSDGRGAGIFCDWDSSPTIRDCWFIADTAEGRGGAIGCDHGSSPTIVDCRFHDNWGFDGGGIACETDTYVNISQCVFTGNYAYYGGGAIYAIYAEPTVSNCTIFDNRAPRAGYGGAGIFLDGAHLTIERSIIAYNREGAGVQCWGSPNSTADISCCAFFGNQDSDIDGCPSPVDCIFLDPLFCDTLSGDFSIRDDSPCAPDNNSCSLLIGALDVGCYSPTVDTVTIDTVGDNQHVLSPTPLIQWEVSCEGGEPEGYEIAIGTDDDWVVAEMWSPGYFSGSDTEVTYAGEPLSDGSTYHLRIREECGSEWTSWYETTFRMNTPPGTPDTLSPSLWESTDGLVTLWFANAADAEGDPLVYEIEGYHDTDCVFGPPIDSTGIPEEEDSTGIFYDLTAAENCFYCWHARAYDGFEYGEWSNSSCFYVDAVAEAPTTPEPIYPVEPQHGVLYDMRPEFLWARGRDGDPGDTVWHRLEVAIDRNFAFVQTADSLHDNRYTLPDSLAFDTRYWWRVTGFDMDGFESVSPAESLWTWTLGDIDRSHEVGLGDLTALIDHLFVSFDPIEPPRVGDLSGDCTISLGDLTLMIDHLFVSFADFTTPGCDPVEEMRSSELQTAESSARMIERQK